jgi:DNA processing protein
LLFHVGPGAAAPERRRVAMVGTRGPDHAFWRQAKLLVTEVVRAGIGVVSGAARGIDSWCHLATAMSGGETWGFLGSGLDQIDPAPARLWRRIAHTNATFFTEYPLGARAEKQTFPRRNRLISGASQAVLVLRADFGSGTRHTVAYAKEQKRPVLAIAGDRFDETSRLCNHLIHTEQARMCLSYIDVMRAVGLKAPHKVKPHTSGPVKVEGLSENARTILERVPVELTEIDALMNDPAIDPAQVVAALFELEMNGLVIRHGGGRVQRV